MNGKIHFFLLVFVAVNWHILVCSLFYHKSIILNRSPLLSNLRTGLFLNYVTQAGEGGGEYVCYNMIQIVISMVIFVAEGRHAYDTRIIGSKANKI